MSIHQKIEEIKNKTTIYTKYEELPKDYINAVIAVEDRRFFEHNGIDLISIARAVGTDIATFSLAEGGSTITQQLAKNTYFTQKKEFTRKIAEIFMAFEYEKECTKEEIFELYVNTMYFGDGYYSISDASKGYFDKNVSDMILQRKRIQNRGISPGHVFQPVEYFSLRGTFCRLIRIYNGRNHFCHIKLVSFTYFANTQTIFAGLLHIIEAIVFILYFRLS